LGGKEDLSDTAIRWAKPGTKPYRIYDREGLFLFITPKGSKLLRWRYRFAGKESLMALDGSPVAGLARGREFHPAVRKMLDDGTRQLRCSNHPGMQSQLMGVSVDIKVRKFVEKTRLRHSAILHSIAGSRRKSSISTFDRTCTGES